MKLSVETNKRVVGGEVKTKPREYELELSVEMAKPLVGGGGVGWIT